MNYYDTEHVQIGLKRYCVYCGEIVLHESEYDDREKLHYYYCNCEGAKLEIEMKELKNKLNEFKYDSRYFDNLRYDHELECLQDKYKHILNK